MAEVVIYVAHSVDGFISDRSGGLDWLAPFEGYDFGYDRFVAGVDAVVMGSNTYRVVRSQGDWPFIDARLVKRLILFQIPVLLGGGASLWPPGKRKTELKLLRSTTHLNGVVETEHEIG